MSNDDNGKSWAIIAAAIITAIVGPILVWFVTNQQVRLQEQSFQATVAVLQTQISMKGGESVQSTKSQPTLRASDTAVAKPMPTVTPRPTATPLPLPTPIRDTPAGAILEIGETWYQGGVLLTLVSASFYADDVNYTFVWLNDTSDTIVTRIDERTFRLLTNNNIELGYRMRERGTESLKPGEKRTFNYRDYGDIGNPSITYIIAIANISRITNARWRIPVSH